MSKAQMLRSLVKQRLTAAAEEIFGLFETTIAEYEEELSLSKEENERKQKLLDAVFSSQLQLQIEDVQQVLVVTEEKDPPVQQERQSSLDQEDPEPRSIKEEQEEIWTSQEGEQLQGLEEADTLFTPVPVKSEDEEQKPQSSQLYQRQTEHNETEADGEDWGGPELSRDSDPDRHPEPNTVKTEEASEPETDASEDWKETREPQSGLNSLTETQISVSTSDLVCGAGEKLFSCSECGKGFRNRGSLSRHARSHTGEKPFSCSVCDKRCSYKENLKAHMRTHSEKKPFSCSVCKKSFRHSGTLQTHMRIHTGQKPYSCPVCKKSFTQSGSVQSHMRIHTGEKPFSCSVCEKRFSSKEHLKIHMRTHTENKPFSCSLCERSFTQSGSLQTHMRVHTGEKPYSCSVCQKSFTQSGSLHKHMRIHKKTSPLLSL